MFTGIIEHLGTALTVTNAARGREILVDIGPLVDGIEVGDSLAVNGICLTVVEAGPAGVVFHAMGETLDKTTIGDVSAGDRVNIERPMPASGRFDGHIVQGHVDGVGRVRSVSPDGSGARMWIDVGPHLLRYVVAKGSITVDGTSLTVADLDDEGLEVALIPHTLAETTLGARESGDRVNLEVDVLAKYVERLMSIRA